jgi:hypothetical protein
LIATAGESVLRSDANAHLFPKKVSHSFRIVPVEGDRLIFDTSDQHPTFTPFDGGLLYRRPIDRLSDARPEYTGALKPQYGRPLGRSRNHVLALQRAERVEQAKHASAPSHSYEEPAHFGRCKKVRDQFLQLQIPQPTLLPIGRHRTNSQRSALEKWTARAFWEAWGAASDANDSLTLNNLADDGGCVAPLSVVALPTRRFAAEMLRDEPPSATGVALRER